MDVHVYSSPTQPATDYYDHLLAEQRGFRPRHRMLCQDCGRVRWAANLSVQVYYDKFVVFCTDREACARARRRRG